MHAHTPRSGPALHVGTPVSPNATSGVTAASFGTGSEMNGGVLSPHATTVAIAKPMLETSFAI